MKFNALEADKRDRILRAAIEEFSREGYEKASTNEIVKNAGISKGALFVYFGSKKKLYLELIHYGANLVQQIMDELDLSETDFFERIKALGWIKLKYMKRMPYVFDFLNGLQNETHEELRSEIEVIKNEMLDRSFALMGQGIDYSKFREDIDLGRTLTMINWVMLGFAEQERGKLNSYNEADLTQIREFDAYLEILKWCFYKPEHQ